MAKRSFRQQTGTTEKAAGETGSGQRLPLLCGRIRYYREYRGMDQKTLAASVGVTANAVSNWENGRSRPDVELLPELCKTLQITLEELFDQRAVPSGCALRERRLIERYRLLTEGHRQALENLTEALLQAQRLDVHPELRRLFRVEKPLAAGLGDPTEFAEEGEAVYVYASPAADRADYVFRVSGDSMLPDFEDGEWVYVEKLRGGAELRAGEIGAFIIGNEMYLKQYRPDGLHSLNPAYPVMRFTEEDAVYLIGRVLGVMPEDALAGEADREIYLREHPDEA